MNTELDTAYKLGQMDARIGNIETAVAGIQQDVKVLLARDAQQKGGKATLAAWGTGGVGVGGVIVAALQLLLGGERPTTAAPPPIVYQQPAPPPAQPRAHADERINPAVPF
jgi:hypothetical protein